MVECTSNLDMVFQALADATRRDILKRVSQEALSISTLAESYPLSFAAVAKHVTVLEAADLIQKQRVGKQQIISVVPATLQDAAFKLDEYQILWNTRFDALDTLLKN